MIIYKFGGASVKDAASFQRIKSIVSGQESPLIIVVSAMGKTTNRLEEIVKLCSAGRDHLPKIAALKQYHLEIAKELMGEETGLSEMIGDIFNELEQQIAAFSGGEFNLFYDQTVSIGEIVSTRMVSEYLEFQGIKNKWLDIRNFLITDDNYRDASVDLEESASRFREQLSNNGLGCFITQGFIGSDRKGNTTTLGREGSDYTAALLAYFLDAEKVVLWKDVPGIYNADPALFRDKERLDRIHFQEMIELAFYGAKVIHPKSIKPLREKKIPLHVKSFFTPDEAGSEVGDFPNEKPNIPCIIVKPEQVLISISLHDLSFINESHISKLFGLLNRFRLKANLMQHSAISFTICVDEPRGRELVDLISILRKEFKVLYNEKLTLFTIRHYTEATILKHTKGKKIYVEQRSRSTVQYLTD